MAARLTWWRPKYFIRKLYRPRRSLDGLANEIIAGPDEIDFESLTKEITEAPFHEVKLLELAISQGRLDSVAGQHRKAALEIFAQRMGQADQTTRGSD